MIKSAANESVGVAEAGDVCPFFCAKTSFET